MNHITRTMQFKDVFGNDQQRNFSIPGGGCTRIELTPEEIGIGYGTVTIDFDRSGVIPFITRELLDPVTKEMQFKFSGQTLRQ